VTRRPLAPLLLLGALLFAGCATRDDDGAPGGGLAPVEARALVLSRLPATLADREAWADDLLAAFGALRLPPSAANLCAVLAVTEQESSYRADPAVPGLARIARQEIERRADAAGVPRFALNAALQIGSRDGRTFAERLDAVKTERQLSEIYEDFIDLVPLGRTFLADRNPVRTGGPMQVGIAFAEAQAEYYPYPLGAGSIRREVFTRRGGLYFGIAHLLAYDAPYPQMLYRFADYNAGRWASRNAAFQQALSAASGVPLQRDGDLLPPGPEQPERPPGATQRAATLVADKLDLGQAAIRRDLEKGEGPEFERTRLYQRVFALADARKGQPLPRATVPTIALSSPKITRPLTTEWFARRVDERHRRCLSERAAGER
jgi:hypothetical protein